MRPRFRLRNRHVLVGDMVLTVMAVLFSFVLRLELDPRPLFVNYLSQALWMVVVALLIKLPVYYRFGLYRRLWVYASVSELKLIFLAVTTASGFVGLGVASLWPLGIFTGPIFLGFPRSTLVIDWLLSMLAVGGLRFSLRLLAESRTPLMETIDGRTRRVLVIGAGDAGALVVREMQKNPQLSLAPLGYLDDDPEKQNQQIHGIPVLGQISDMERVVDTKRIDEVTIAIPSAPGHVIRRVTEACRKKGVFFRTMPGMYELIGGKVSVNRLREVEITDLLRREPAQIDDQLVGVVLGGKRIMVTGAGGSIGLELCRQVARWGPSELILLGHGENSIFESLLELEESFSALALHPLIADIRDLGRLQSIFDDYQPQVVFHAAAHKHVPLMEINVEEAVTNNVLGSRNVVAASSRVNVERMVMISTDKAIRPSSVMGATKRIAEMIVIDAAHRTQQAYSVVRFGNVLGSRGSVIPLFKRQITRGGPVTVTHPEMARYFMTIPEAVHLVLQASAMGHGGEIFVLNMGEQVRILSLAEDLIRLSGLEPNEDINIVFTGIRPGEKLREDLWDQGADYQSTDHPDILHLTENDVLAGRSLEQAVNEMIRLAREGDTTAVVELMDELIPGAVVRSTPPPDLTSIV